MSATYLVFGRQSYAEPLEQRGTLQAADREEARRRARERFGDGWVELVLVPQEEAHWVLGAPPAAEEAGRVGTRLD
jgi:hypothetical protein